jgi:hypothetical protein
VPPDPGEIDRPKFRVWLRPDGIVQLVWTPNVLISRGDAIEAIDALAQLTGGRPSPLLVDAHAARTQDRRARAEFVSRIDLVSAIALLVTTPLSRMMGNFFIGVSRPMVQTRLFEREAPAVAWLMPFVRQR